MIPSTLHDELIAVDKKIINLNPEQICRALSTIPLDVFGRLQIDRPTQYPNLVRWFAQMPSAEEQRIWAGAHGHTLMTQSLAFMKTVVATYHELSEKPLRDSTVLDFGCGWGRMLRLLSKYMPTDKLYAVDPWDKSIEVCQQTGVNANLYLSDYLPKSLPTPDGQKFNFIFAFSVFTHLSEKATKQCIKTLSNYLTEGGVLAITIRPEEYWSFIHKHAPDTMSAGQASELVRRHREAGFAFVPHNRAEIEGDITYGDTSMKLDFIKENFSDLSIERIELSEVDLYQIIVFLTKRTN